MIEEKDLLPVFDLVLDFVGQAVQNDESNRVKIAELNQQLVQTERLTLEKVAAAKAEVFPPTELDQALNELVMMRVFTHADSVKVASQLRDDPTSMLKLLVKISESLISPMEGHGIPRTTSTEDDPDLDGWGAFASGREVRIKR